jgi:hypothetical protein
LKLLSKGILRLYIILSVIAAVLILTLDINFIQVDHDNASSDAKLLIERQLIRQKQDLGKISELNILITDKEKDTEAELNLKSIQADLDNLKNQKLDLEQALEHLRTSQISDKIDSLKIKIKKGTEFITETENKRKISDIEARASIERLTLAINEGRKEMQDCIAHYGENDPLVVKFKKGINLCEEKRTALEIDLEVGNKAFNELTETVTKNIEGFRNEVLSLSNDLSSKTKALEYLHDNHEYITISKNINTKRVEFLTQKELADSLREELSKERLELNKFKIKYENDRTLSTSDQKNYENYLSKSVWNNHDYLKFIYIFLIGLTVWSVLYFTILLLTKMIILVTTWIIEGFKNK